MLRSIRFVRAGFVIAMSLVLVACHHGSGGSSAAATAYVRLVNATPSGSLGLALNQSSTSTNMATGLAPNSVSGYVGVAAGAYSSTVTDANGLNPSTSPLSLGGTYYTVLASQRDGVIRQNVIVDNQAAPAGCLASFNVADFSLDAGNLTVYVLAPGNTPTSGNETFAIVNYGSSTTPQLFNSGLYTVTVTANGNVADVRLTSAVTLSCQEILTFALTGTPGGGLVNGVLSQQGGAVSVLPATNARVRVVSAFPPGSSVTATVGGTALSSVPSPSVGSYTLVPAPSTGFAISVSGGGSATDTVTTLTAGRDYTILVYGSAGAPTATVLTDINQTLGSDAVLRVVNGSVSSGNVSLSDNAVTKFTNLPLGTISANYGVLPSNVSSVEVTSAGVPISCSNCSGVTLDSGGVYTYFVLNPSGPEVILSRDR